MTGQVFLFVAKTSGVSRSILRCSVPVVNLFKNGAVFKQRIYKGSPEGKKALIAGVLNNYTIDLRGAVAAFSQGVQLTIPSAYKIREGGLFVR